MRPDLNRLLLYTAILSIALHNCYAGYDFDSVFPTPDVWAPTGSTATISDVYTASDASPWAVSFPETDVFAFSMKGSSSTLGNYTLRVGKGGQIFSIRVNGDEWIPPSYRSGATPDRAPWNDEVFQFVAVNTNIQTEQRTWRDAGEHHHFYFIHGSGIYLDDSAFDDTPFYNPMLASEADNSNGRIMTANWGQQAHVPTTWTSGLVYFTRYTDRGAGIIEVECVMHNSDPTPLNYFNFPWGGTRISSLPLHYLYNSNGSRFEAGTAEWEEGSSLDLELSAGYMAFTSNSNTDAPALVLVHGNTVPTTPVDFNWGDSLVRYGSAGATPDPLPADETSWRNYNVSSVVRRVNLNTGESLYARYYIIIGELDDAISKISTHGLVAKSGITKTAYSLATAGIAKAYYANASTTPLTPTDSPDAGQKPWFYVSSAPIEGWKPLLLAEPTTITVSSNYGITAASTWPTENVVASQYNGGQNSPVYRTATQTLSSGQTFTLTEPTTLDKLYLYNNTSFKNTGNLRLWIGGYNGSSPVLPGTTYTLSSVTWFVGIYQFDFENLTLPAGTYAFQLNFEAESASNALSFSRAGGTGTYTTGGRLFSGTSTLPFSSNPADTFDLQFAITKEVAQLEPVVTNDFYKLAHHDGLEEEDTTGEIINGADTLPHYLYKAYNGNTESWRLLGFVAPDSAALSGMGYVPNLVNTLDASGNTIDVDAPSLFTWTTDAGDADPNIQMMSESGTLKLQNYVPVGEELLIEDTDDLTNPIIWSPYQTLDVGTNATIEVILPAPTPSTPQKFYRLNEAP